MDWSALLVAIFVVGVITLCQSTFCEDHPLYGGVPQDSVQQAKECHNLDTMEIKK